MITNDKGDILGFSSSPKKIKTIAMQVITLLQDHKRGDVIIALAVLWIMVCERFGISPIKTLSTANKIRSETFDHKHDSQLRALKDYMANEL